MKRVLFQMGLMVAFCALASCSKKVENAEVAAPAEAAEIPYGVPVAGKPGFVTSPYSPDSGYVDLRGFESGNEVKDPYTGKIFKVP